MTAIETTRATGIRSAFGALATLFRYPTGDDLRHLRDVEETVRPFDRAAAGAVRAFSDTMAAIDLAGRQMAYTMTFDLAPSCSPYLGVQLFGDESPQRARLMVGLRAAYEKHHVAQRSAELPDHLSEVLAFAAHYDDGEWSDLLRLVLVPAMAKMDEILRPTVNPYRHAIAVTRHLAERAVSEGGRGE